MYTPLSLHAVLEETLGSLLARRKSRNTLRRLSTAAPGTVDFSSNGYLSLSTNAAVQQALLARLQAAVDTTTATAASSASPRASILGSGGSRLLDGNSSLAESLEARIAAFHGAGAGLLFTSAFDANVGLLACVPQPGDVVLYDELIHASAHDGMRLSRAARKLPFAHASVAQSARRCGVDGEAGQPVNGSGVRGLGEILEQLVADEGSRRVRDGEANVFVCVEGLYSMDGDVPALEEVVETVDRYLPLGNGYIIVDEAHSVGIFGDQGRGLVCELGLENRVWARVLGFGKALGAAGGIVLCSPTTRAYLINYARSLIYTTSMTFTSLASIDAIYDYLISGQSKPLREHLDKLIQYTHSRLQDLCGRQRPGQHILHVRRTPSKSPVIPLFTASPRKLADYCQQRRFMVRPIVAPTVAAGTERVRICLHASNTFEQVQGLCRAIEAWVQGEMATGELWKNSQHCEKGTHTRDNICRQDKPRL
ncbi:PLP-dependent transferase [Xylariaceae sp. FL0662B]|nr:PLP-dependent transferase [Xylariaceae sp. FL0662B]